MDLQSFLNANPVDGITEEFSLGGRFGDLKFKVKACSSQDFEALRKSCLIIKKGGKSVEFDSQSFGTKLVIENTIEPNFKDKDSIEKLGVRTPEEYLNKVLTAGEVTRLHEKIQQVSGFGESMDDLVEEAKN